MVLGLADSCLDKASKANLRYPGGRVVQRGVAGEPMSTRIAFRIQKPS